MLAVYAALLRPGDTVPAMDLAHGGRLAHGSPAHVPGGLLRFTGCGTRSDDGRIDYDAVRTLALRPPRALVCGSTACPRPVDHAALRAVADESGALPIADCAHPRGLVAGAAAPGPVPYADVVRGTTHKALRAPAAGCCCAAPAPPTARSSRTSRAARR